MGSPICSSRSAAGRRAADGRLTDEDVARPMRDYVGERAEWLAELVRAAQNSGELDQSLSPDALAHFRLLLSMGSALITPDLHAVDDDEWGALLARLVGALTPPPTSHRAEHPQ
jgi:hypothetical protein